MKNIKCYKCKHRCSVDCPYNRPEKPKGETMNEISFEMLKEKGCPSELGEK